MEEAVKMQLIRAFMFHKIFQWRHLKRRKGTNPSLRGVDHRSSSSDLIQYVRAFAGKDPKFPGLKRRVLRKCMKATLVCGLVIFAIWFAMESYEGLRLLD